MLLLPAGVPIARDCVGDQQDNAQDQAPPQNVGGEAETGEEDEEQNRENQKHLEHLL